MVRSFQLQYSVISRMNCNSNNTTLVPSWSLAVWSLWRREVVRFLRQRGRVVGAFATPIVFWLLIGSGLRESFAVQAEGTGATSMNYLEYFFPGTMVMIVLFTAIFSTISVIEDRREGFLQAVVAAPVPRSAIAMGKILGSSTLAFGQAMLFLLLAIPTGLTLSLGSTVAVAGVLLFVSLGLSGLGLLIAWPMDSTQGFHAIMNLLLVPMWILSGALFPASGASSWIAWIMAANPLTYGLAAVRRAMYPDASGVVASLPAMSISLSVTVLFALAMIWLATRVVERHG